MHAANFCMLSLSVIFVAQNEVSGFFKSLNEK